MLGLCTLGLALRPRQLDEPALRETVLAAVLALTLGVVAALLVPGRLAGLLSRLGGLFPAAVAGQARDRAGPARAIGLSLYFYGTVILAQHGVLRAVGAEVSLVAAVVPLLTMLPVSLNGLGVAEGVFVLLYARRLGVLPEAALAAAVLRRLVDLANYGLGGLLWLTLPGGPGEARGSTPPGDRVTVSDPAPPSGSPSRAARRRFSPPAAAP